MSNTTTHKTRVYIGLQATPELDTAVRIAAGRRRMSKSDWFREAIAEKLQRDTQAALEQVPATARG